MAWVRWEMGVEKEAKLGPQTAGALNQSPSQGMEQPSGTERDVIVWKD